MVQLHRHTRDDRGVTLVELLVSMILMAAVALIASTAIMWVQRTTTSQIRNGELWADMQDASTQLLRDVTDGQRILVADPNTLTIEVVRDSKCQVREWVADTTAKRLSVNTTFYEQAQCIGTPSGTRTDRLVGDNAVGTNTSGSNPKQYISPATFAYFEALSTTPLASPVETDRVTRVEWDLQAKADDAYRTELLKSGAAFTPRASQQAGGGDQANPKSALLCNVLRLLASGTTTCDTTPLVSVTPGAVEGKDPPVLQWVDRSPPGVTTGWTVLRVANPEGMADTAAGRTTWSYLTSLPAATTSFKDSTLPDGFTAQYLVASNVTTGLGPVSNKIVSGLRPAAPTVTATGSPTSIAVTWTASVGATGYDVFRDGVLAASITDGATLSWTDTLGYGHAHTYQVVAVNRWENRLTTTTDTGRVDLGALLSDPHTGGARLASTSTAASSAFTAPATPSLTATPDTAWGDTVAWTPGPWAGSGPSTKGGASRDRGWETQQATLSGPFTDLWVGGAGEVPGTTTTKLNGSRAPGSTTHYQARTCNAVGCSPYSGAVSSLQRPPAPSSCTASGPSTRSMTLTVNSPAIESGYSLYSLQGGSGDPTGTGDSGSPVFGVDQLTHGTTHTFTARAQNGSPANGGWSDTVNCQGATDVLASPTIAIGGVTTRAAVASPSCSNGSSCSASISGGANSRNDLADNTTYSATATNSDGYNTVGNSTSFKTVLLTAPSCHVTGGGSDPSGTITVAISTGSNGSEQVNAGSGWVSGTSTTRSGLGTGTYSGSARGTDGLNYTGSVGCGSVTVSFTASAWGSTAPGCPGVAVYVTPTSYNSYQVRRYTATVCQARTVSTQTGADANPDYAPAGTQLALYSILANSADPGWALVSGVGGSPTGLPAGW